MKIQWSHSPKKINSQATVPGLYYNSPSYRSKKGQHMSKLQLERNTCDELAREMSRLYTSKRDQIPCCGLLNNLHKQTSTRQHSEIDRLETLHFEPPTSTPTPLAVAKQALCPVKLKQTSTKLTLYCLRHAATTSTQCSVQPLGWHCQALQGCWAMSCKLEEVMISSFCFFASSVHCADFYRATVVLHLTWFRDLCFIVGDCKVVPLAQ